MGRVYDEAVWQRLRKAILSKNPLCVNCNKVGINEKATDVDHIISIRNGGRKYHVDNLQPLCHRCHSSKTAKERRKKEPPPPRCDDRGRPNPDYIAWKKSRLQT